MIWIRRVIRITTFLALGSSASTPSGPGHHKEVAFPRRAALLHSTILVLADYSQPSIQDIHCQDPFGSSAPFRSLLDSQTPKRDSNPFGSSGLFRTSLDSQTPRRESGHHSTVKLLVETQTHLGLLHLGHHSTVKLQEETRTHLGLQGLSEHLWRLREKTDRWSGF
ncbi:uncharacterized protein LOC126623822 [Malus sylvestris]|uniref:uncharacterized protein LOC126623822 n=1 Tax=Malus sylvestris TaxID=3752 RepID=UPI0021AC8302|nr:uncharacterized protein LOC126623822 [Malus sylvestris]